MLSLFALDASAAPAPAILVVGDSLSAGYGIELRDGWVMLLQQHLTRLGYPHRVVNASIAATPPPADARVCRMRSSVTTRKS